MKTGDRLDVCNLLHTGVKRLPNRVKSGINYNWLLTDYFGKNIDYIIDYGRIQNRLLFLSLLANKRIFISSLSRAPQQGEKLNVLPSAALPIAARVAFANAILSIPVCFKGV